MTNITFEETLSMIKGGKTLELMFCLSGPLYSRHELSFSNGKIRDFSYVDSSVTMHSIKRYRRSFYGKLFDRRAVQLSEER